MPKKGKPKIFIGFHEIGDYTLRLAQGMRELGFEVTHTILRSEDIPPSKKRNEQPDRYIKYNNWAMLQVKLSVEFLRNFLSHDIFIFNFGESFFSTGLSENMNPFLYMFYSRYLDWKTLKALGKKIIVTTLGCDIRHYIPMEKWANKYGIKYNVCMECDQKAECSLSVKKQIVKMIERYADHIFSHVSMGHLFKKPYNEIWVPINLNSVKYKVHKTNNPLILHAPTKPKKKGTKYIVEAIEKLKEEGYKFRFLLCQNMHHEELIKKMVESEIVVDQVLAQMCGYGLFSIEGMATGNVVLKSFSPDLPGCDKSSKRFAPILPTNPANIYDNLKLVLEDPDLRLKLADEGMKYVKNNHDHIKVARRFLKTIGEL